MDKAMQERITKVLAEAEAKAEMERIKVEAERKAEMIEACARANAEARKATEELRARLEREHGTTTHPKRDLLWSKAWEHGHSSGLAEVEYWYEDLVELLTW